jgi:nucleoside-diphosphate-sugar epimerase
VIWQSRRSGQDPFRCWSEQYLLTKEPASRPQVRAVVALWGVVPDTGQNLHHNTDLALRAMQIATLLGADRVLHCSSAAVYRPGSGRLSEDAPPCPQSPYGQSKLAMEQALREWHATSGENPASCVMRIGNVLGADSLSASMAAAAKSQQRIRLDRFADGRAAYRSFLSGADLARCLAALTDCPLAELPDIVNVAAPQATAMDTVLRHAGLDYAWQDAPAQAAPIVELDTRRLQKLLDLGADSSSPAHLLADWPWPEGATRNDPHLKGSQP